MRAIFRFLLVLGILANLGLIIIFATEKKETELVQSWEKYSSRTGKFSVSYPERWSIVEVDLAGTYIETKFHADHDAFYSVRTMMIDLAMDDLLKHARFSEEKPLSHHHKNAVSSIGNSYHDFERSETFSMKIRDQEALCTPFECKIWNPLESRRMKGLVVSTLQKDRHVVLMLLSSRSGYDRMFDVFGAAVQTLEVSSLDTLPTR